MDDSKIVDLYLARSESAIQATSEKFGKKIINLAKRICGDETVAQECENDTYLGAWNSIPPHEPRSYLLAFLLKITRNLAINRLKSSYRQKRNANVIELTKEIEECIGSKTDVEAEIDGVILSHLINEFLQAQTEEKRYIFTRRYWFMDPISSIARRMGLSEGKVKTVLFRMRKELKKHLKDSGYEI